MPSTKYCCAYNLLIGNCKHFPTKRRQKIRFLEEVRDGRSKVHRFLRHGMNKCNRLCMKAKAFGIAIRNTIFFVADDWTAVGTAMDADLIFFAGLQLEFNARPFLCRFQYSIVSDGKFADGRVVGFMDDISGIFIKVAFPRP